MLRMRARIVAPGVKSTCISGQHSLIDYFVVSDGLSHGVHGVARLSDSGVHPHYFTRILLASDIRRHRVRRIVRARPVPGATPSLGLPPLILTAILVRGFKTVSPF